MNFLLELASEEIPARMQAAAAEQLRTRFVDGLKAAGLAHGEVVADATPRRLWLIAHDVAAASTAASEERKGPSASAPEQAIAGFLRSTGLTRDQLEERQTPKGVVLFAHIRSEGRTAAAILADLVPTIVRDFAWPKSMRWGVTSASTASPRWVRPLTGIVALLDGEIVACEVHGVTSGRTTRGHRIHAPDAISVGDARTYAAQLRDAKVIVSSAERRELIAERAGVAAAAKGMAIIPDAGLVAENAGLTEWPVPLLGGFDPAFLAVPPEVIQLTMRTNQKYFACLLLSRLREGPEVGESQLAPAFVCVANLEASDGGVAIVAGNERVLSARLSDAKFFWDQDVAKVKAGGLEAFLPKLSDIVFHEKLGTVADKVDRVAKLARWMVESGAVTAPLPAREGPGVGGSVVVGASSVPHSPTLSPSLEREGSSLADLAEQAARLCKADLVSATVGEFPEVQGIAGAYLARVVGLDPQVADAIRDHYKPVGQGDDVPTAPVSVAVALADKLDTLLGFYLLGQKPTGSRDPFALRRAMLGVIRTILDNGIRVHLTYLVRQAMILNIIYLSASEYIVPNLVFEELRSHLFAEQLRLLLLAGGEQAHDARKTTLIHSAPEVAADLGNFLVDRLKVQQREAGVRHDLIDAVFALGNEDDLVRLLARVQALQAFVETTDGANLLIAYRRADGILKVEEGKDGRLFTTEIDEARFSDNSEFALNSASIFAIATARIAVADEDFDWAMEALSHLRPAIDGFFAAVRVNDLSPDVRENRLALLARFRDAVHSVADFSKIEG